MTENNLQNYFLNNCDDNNLLEALEIIKPRKTVGSLAALDELSGEEYLNYIRLSNIEKESATGTEIFPGNMMSPTKKIILKNNILEILVAFYNNSYEENFIPLSQLKNPENNKIIVSPHIFQYGRLRIGGDIYGSVEAARYIKSSYILAKFVQNDGSIDTYPGQVQFYFEHTLYMLCLRLTPASD
jgi:hypothetical protein